MPVADIARPSPFGRDVPDLPVRTRAPEAPKAAFQLDPASSIDDLHSVLDTTVVGQDDGKGRLAVLLSLHLAAFDDERQGRPIANAMLIGPTGVGKTHSMRSLAESFAIPFVVVDSTSIVPSGIVGFQVEDVMQLLFDEARRILREGGYRDSEADISHLAERGVVFLDEFDKLGTPLESETSTDASRRLVQRRLLKLAEGAKIRVGVKQRGFEKDIYLDTSNLLIIAGGAFADLRERTSGRRRNSELYRQLFGETAIVAEDIRLYGFMPELVARFPLIIEYAPLTPQELYRIVLQSDDSPLQVWKTFSELRGFALEVTPEALAIVAMRAAKLGVGARGLQQLLFPYLSQRFLLASREGSTEVTVTQDDLRATGELYAAVGGLAVGEEDADLTT